MLKKASISEFTQDTLKTGLGTALGGVLTYLSLTGIQKLRRRHNVSNAFDKLMKHRALQEIPEEQRRELVKEYVKIYPITASHAPSVIASAIKYHYHSGGLVAADIIKSLKELELSMREA